MKGGSVLFFLFSGFPGLFRDVPTCFGILFHAAFFVLSEFALSALFYAAFTLPASVFPEERI